MNVKAAATTALRESFDPDVFNPEIETWGNQLTSSGYSYDSAGNATADAQGRTFVYDAENKQVSVSDGGGAIGQYWYDGDGRRVKKWDRDSGEVTVFVYDAAGKLIAEYTPTLRPTEDAKVAYLTNDHLGSPRINTDANGAVTARHDYHPFGEEITTSQRVAGLGYASDSVRKQFTAYERDNESSLDFAEARYYNSQHGRFTSPDLVFADQDVAIPLSWNMYSYVRNNPLSYTDPDGLELRWAGDINKAREFTCGILGTADCSDRVKYNEKTGVVTIDTKGIDLSKNEGAKLLSQLDGSKSVYQLTVSEQIDTKAGTRSLSGLLENLDKNHDDRYEKTDSQLPPSGVDDNVGILPKVITISGPSKLAPPLWLIAFHELAESFAKIDGNKQYGGANGAHQEALEREAILRRQRPDLSIFHLGGVPEATFLKLGPKNSVRYVSGSWPYKDVPTPKSK